MENPDFFDDEVIADSEEEIDPNMTLDPNLGVLGRGANLTSSVSAFTTAGYPQARPFSAISEFTGDTPARPAHRNDLPENISGEPNQTTPDHADISRSSINNTFTDFEGMSMPGNIADRAKMRQRTQKIPSVDVSDVIELSSDDDDDEMVLKPSTSKTKPTSKPKPKPKAKQKAKEIPSEAAETPDISTKSLLPSKPRPRPIPLKKRAKPPQDAAPAASTPGPELPIATSPPPMQPNHRATSQSDSQLPPSDPPILTFRTAYSKENETGLPLIETLPRSVAGGPLSSPSSLFSEAGATTKKRGGRSVDSDAEIDELAPSDDGPVGYYQSKKSILLGKMPPPPTFFAGSSPLPMEGEGGETLPVGSDAQLEIVDLSDLPPTFAPVAKSKPSTDSKKAKKKKKNSDFDQYDDMAAPMVVLDEDEQDDDFDPSGYGEKKKNKTKTKEKKGKTKSKSSESTGRTEGGHVEVLITTKPPKAKTKKKEKADTKTKGKDKDLVKGGDKDVFKSREFIEDSDEDDPLQLVEGSSVAHNLGTTSRPAPQEKGTSSPTKLTITIPVGQYPSALPVTVEPTSPLSDIEMPKSKPSKSKNSNGSKKRKSLVDSDHEEDAYQAPENDSSPTTKKRKVNDASTKKEKSTSGRKGKTKQIVLSDDEAEETFDMDTGESPLDVETRNPEKKKSPKMIVDEQDGNHSGNEDSELNQQERTSKPRSVDKSIKENIAPPVSKPSVVSTPKPSKPIPLNDDGTTPLYARYEIAPRRSSLPMSELIRRANSMPGSPFSTSNPSSASASVSASSKSKLKPLLTRRPSSTAYSPYVKSSRSLLSRIAPLHPNRKTPPPPPPPPPPRKKSKKELELEAKWEEEIVDEVGGMEAWAALQDDERKEMRKMKWAMELGGWDD